MWLCTQHGFFSIVLKGGHYHVRARERGDLARLLRVAGLNLEILQSPDADYRWRVLVGQEDLDRVFGALSGSIDYGNFKGRIHDLPDQAAKAPAYGRLWADLLRLQR
jgi:hypothetical protein